MPPSDPIHQTGIIIFGMSSDNSNSGNTAGIGGSTSQSNTSASRTTGNARSNPSGPLLNEEQRAARDAVRQALSDPEAEKLMKTMGESSQEKRRGNCDSSVLVLGFV